MQAIFSPFEFSAHEYECLAYQCYISDLEWATFLNHPFMEASHTHTKKYSVPNIFAANAYRGSPRVSSIAVNLGLPPTPFSDLISLSFVLLSASGISLPWAQDAHGKGASGVPAILSTQVRSCHVAVRL
jgi:hypothetical protein